MMLQVPTELRPDEQVPEEPSHPDMAWIPGGTFRMGSDRHYPEEAPVHRVTVDPFWIDRTPVTNRQFRQFVERDGLCHRRRDRAGPQGLSRRIAAHAEAGLARLHAAAAPRRPAGLATMVELRIRRELAPARTAAANRTTASTTIRWCMSHCRTPKPTPPGRARRCRPRQSGNTPRAAAWTGPSSPGATN